MVVLVPPARFVPEVAESEMKDGAPGARDALQFKGRPPVLLVLLIVMGCDDVPEVTLNGIVAVLTPSAGGAVMSSVIIMTCGVPTGWFALLVAVMVTVPVYVPAPRPVSETPTLVADEAERLTLPEGEALSHEPPVEVTTDADQFNELLQAPLAVMVAGCGAGFDPPTRPA